MEARIEVQISFLEGGVLAHCFLGRAIKERACEGRVGCPPLKFLTLTLDIVLVGQKNKKYKTYMDTSIAYHTEKSHS